MKGERETLYRWALQLKQPIDSKMAAEFLGIDLGNASAHLSEMEKQGCFTRKWNIEGLRRWYTYTAKHRHPPMGKGGYPRKQKIATPRIPAGHGFRYVPIERMSIVRMQDAV